jgi:hypothetical protein
MVLDPREIVLAGFAIWLVASAITEAAQIRLRDEESALLQKVWHGADAVAKGVFIYMAAPDWKERLELALAFWVLFDLMLNGLRKRKWYYVGVTAWTDRMLHKLPFTDQGITLFKLLLVTTTLYLINR